MPKSQQTSKSEKKSERSQRTGKRLLGYFKPHWHLFAIGLLCTTLIQGISVWFIYLIRDVVNIAAAAKAGGLGKTALLIVGIHVIKWILTYTQTYCVQSATQRIAVSLRNALYSQLNRLSLGYFERTKVGHLMSKMTNDVGLVQNSAPSITNFVSAPVAIIMFTITIFKCNWKLSLVAMIVLPLMSYVITKLGRGMRGLSDMLQVRLADVAAVVQETLSAMRIVKSFATEDYENARFADENRQTYGAAMRAVRRSAAISPTIEFIGVSGIAFVLWYGGQMVVNHSIPGFDIGTLVFFLLALERIASSARDVGGLSATYHTTMAGAQRVFDILDENPEIVDASDAKAMPPIEGRIEFQDVVFSYNRKEKVLDGVSFSVEPGQQVALVGPSGAGKSTISNLVPRLYDISSGSILIDGIDIRDVTLNSLRRQIAIVPQDTILFSTSIKENIAYGRMDATYEEIIDAAKAANAHSFIDRLPEKYDTPVGERGVRLSGGERQRVAIARALLKNPKLLILDEATSSLDVASEAIVQEALERLMKDRTSLVIAHRLSTVIGADKILVMDRGRIVESGTHKELIAKGGLYAELYTIQNKGSDAINGVLQA